ncbi:MAG: stage V sporulation protein AC [Clostridia bacterium]|nr:stage V sporulation protein AC [Clostridia bacterium]
MFKKTNKEYSDYVSARTPKTKPFANIIAAFLVGGAICVLGQGLADIYVFFGLPTDSAKLWSTVSLVFLSALLTALHIYDDIARFAGAGIVVPITGFANAVASPAIEFKTEGFVLGMAANMFKVAGPVIVYGVSASVVYGVIYWVTTLF